jgi:hypothetical protein
MRKGFAERHSRAAGWARLLGGLAVPVLVLTALGTRIGLVPAEALLPALVLGFLLALAAMGIAASALVDVWRSGATGAGPAIAGLVYAAPALILLALVAAAGFLYPRLTDISTDPGAPPGFLQPQARSASASNAAAQQGDDYPDLAPRLYDLPIAQVYTAVRTLVEDRGWTIRTETPPPSYEGPIANEPRQEQAAAAAAPAEQAIAGKQIATQSRREAQPAVGFAAAPAAPGPAPPSETGSVQSVARTLLFGFSDDVVIRLQSSPDGTRVDMRSASARGLHDLGENARRIRRFLADLDAILQPEPGAEGVPVASGFQGRPAAGQ